MTICFHCMQDYDGDKCNQCELEIMAQEIIERIEKFSEIANDKWRMDLISGIRELMCLECGSPELPCYCTRDD